MAIAPNNLLRERARYQGLSVGAVNQALSHGLREPVRRSTLAHANEIHRRRGAAGLDERGLRARFDDY